MNIALSLKIKKELQLEEGFLTTLRVHHDIKLDKFDRDYKPDLSKINKGIFWDTTFERMDWKSMKRGVIVRVFSYGGEEEQQEIIRFYGKEEVNLILKEVVLRHQS